MKQLDNQKRPHGAATLYVRQGCCCSFWRNPKHKFWLLGVQAAVTDCAGTEPSLPTHQAVDEVEREGVEPHERQVVDGEAHRVHHHVHVRVRH